MAKEKVKRLVWPKPEQEAQTKAERRERAREKRAEKKAAQALAAMKAKDWSGLINQPNDDAPPQ